MRSTHDLGAQSAIVRKVAHARRGVPNRGEYCQAAKRAAADIEGHSEGAKFSQPGRLSANRIGPAMHYFLLGPSGVGKTWFGDWLAANRHYHHIRVDNGDQGSELQKEPGLWGLWNRVITGSLKRRQHLLRSRRPSATAYKMRRN
jgi:hypothetical protein